MTVEILSIEVSRTWRVTQLFQICLAMTMSLSFKTMYVSLLHIRVVIYSVSFSLGLAFNTTKCHLVMSFILRVGLTTE